MFEREDAKEDINEVEEFLSEMKRFLIQNHGIKFS